MAAELPPPKAIKDLLEGLLGRDVEVGIGDPVANADAAVLAVYVTDALKMSAVVTVDLPLAAYLGTSIAVIPPGGAEAAIEDGELSPAIFDNVGEVLNVFAATLNEYNSDHTRLYGTHHGQNDSPADALLLSATQGNRLDLTISVAKYGTGHLSCILTAA